MHVNLSSLEGQRARDERRLKYSGVETLEQRDVTALLRRREDDDAAALGGRELPVVKVIAIETNQRPSKLTREPVMFAVAGAAKIVVLDDEERVPVQDPAHERHKPRRYVRIHVDARLLRQPLRVWTEFRRQRSH